MKPRTFSARLLSLVGLTAFFLVDAISYSQGDTNQKAALKLCGDMTINESGFSLSQPVIDTHTVKFLNLSNKPVIDEVVSPQWRKRTYLDDFDNYNVSLKLDQHRALTENELNSIREQQRLILEENHRQLHEQARKQAFQIDMEGIVRGIKTKPF
jgi:hypothetical protein